MYLPFFVIGLLTLFIQISSNELLLRGYTRQFARRLTTNPVLIIVLPAIVSAAPHLPNLIGMGQPTYGILISLINGCLYGWLAHRSRTLWMPVGFYWGNN